MALSAVNNVIIPAGLNKIRFYFDKGGSNVSLFQFLSPVAVSSVPFTFISGATNTAGTSIILTLNKPVTTLNAFKTDFEVLADGNPLEIDTILINYGNSRLLVIGIKNAIYYGQTVSISYSGNSIFSNTQALGNFSYRPVKNCLPRRFIIPALIQAEDFNVNYGFQLEDCSDVNGGKNIGFAKNGNYLDYNIYIPAAGDYNLRFRVASLYSNGSISVRLGDGGTFTQVRTVNFTATGGWQTWTTQVFIVDLPQGNYTLRFYSASGEYNINWFEITQPADVNEIPQLKQFRIFPNPTDGSFFVAAEFDNKTPVTFVIYDLYGNSLVKYSIGNTTSFSRHINDLDCKPGIYFLDLSTQMGHLTKKVVVN